MSFDLKEMKSTTYDYEWSRVWLLALSLTIVIAWAVWKNGPLNNTELVVVGSLLVGFGIFHLLPVTKVHISDQEIHIYPLIPLMKSHSLLIRDVEGYTPVEIKRKTRNIPLAGVLKPINHEKGIMINAAGIKNFNALNDQLKQLFPKAKEIEHAPPAGRVEAPRP